MKTIIISIVILVFSTCGQKEHPPSPYQEEMINEDVIFIQDKTAMYKHGDHSILMNNLMKSIGPLTVQKDSIVNHQGIYQILIDEKGNPFEFEVKKSIHPKIDDRVQAYCDTLSFYPAELNGNKIKSKLTLPLRLNFQ